MPPGQCLQLSMHGWPSLDPPVHVFTHVLGLGHVPPQAVAHVIADGHTHGPLNAYFTPLTPSTTATMSKALTFAFSSGTLGCNWVMAFTRAPGRFFNLVTTAATSRASG